MKINKVPKINSFALASEQSNLKGKSVYEFANKHDPLTHKGPPYLGTEYESTISKYSSNQIKWDN